MPRRKKMLSLTVTAVLGDVKVKSAKVKAESSYGTPKKPHVVGGSLTLPFEVQRPEVPWKPTLDSIYDWDQRQALERGDPGEFTEPEKPEDFDDVSASEKRKWNAKVKKDRAKHAKAVKVYQGALKAQAKVDERNAKIEARYAKELESMPDEYRSYALLSSLGVMFAGLPCKITIEPINDGMLPGMGPELLLGTPVVEAEESE